MDEPIPGPPLPAPLDGEGCPMWTYDEHGHPVGPGFVICDGYDREMAKRSVGPGWHFLLDTLFDHIEQMARDNSTQITVSQVKEKWGTLRIYSHSAGQFAGEDFAFVSALEHVSSRFCEDCAQPTLGVLREGSWLRTLCDRHAEGRPAVTKEDE